jgi:hypothetical protein
MTVLDLINQLKKFPPDAKVYCEGGDYKDDWREIRTVSHGQVWEVKGVFLE